jgi:protein-S-isoprenylcysteine O-methyltransferase Ste14
VLRWLSVLAFLSMVAGVLVLCLPPRALFSWSPIVIAIQAAAVVLMLWARRTFGRRSFHAAADPTAGGLVTSGPYRYIRHPIYAAICYFVWAGVAANLSFRATLAALLVTTGAIVRMLCEERLLTIRYPEYLDYAGRTKRMVPGVF